jgi:phosphoglycerol transferase MdoB-like AlkP superfamily enzyme
MVRYLLLASLLFISFLVFVEFGYLSYYLVPIDVLFFGLIDGDTTAVLKSMIGDFRTIVVAGLCLISISAITWVYLALTPKTDSINPSYGWPYPLIIRLLVGLLLLILARGSLDTFPLQRKMASVGDNPFMNLVVMNSSFNLYYAWKDNQSSTADVFNRDILNQHKLDNYNELLVGAGYSVDNPLVRASRHAETTIRPPHVVFVLMEGWSTQIALKHSDENQVLGSLAPHLAEDHFFPYVLANTFATNSAIEMLLLNSPITPLSQSIAKNTHFQTSNVLPFKRSGYATSFISGGYASWRNHDNFWLKQGFDDYIGRSEIESKYQVEAKDHPWGVYDEYLFTQLKHYLVENEANGKPSFSFVLTTTNHSPMRLPESYRRPPLQPQQYGLDPALKSSFELLTGFNYLSESLAGFLDWLKSSELAGRVIVVATGDHPLRTLAKTNNSLSTQFLRYAVPAYIYTPPSIRQLKDVPTNIAASHSDLFPTLFELALPGEEYYGFGEPLMSKERRSAYGWADRGVFLFERGVAHLSGKMYPWLDSDRVLLKGAAEPLTDINLDAIERERFRRILKTYLLVEDYRAPAPADLK